MSGRALLFLIAGMSASFLVVLLMVSAVMEPDRKRRPVQRSSRARVEASPEKVPAQSRRDVRPKNDLLTKTPPASTPHSLEKATVLPVANDSAEKAGRIQRAEDQVRQAAQAAREFKIVRNELRQQIAALKQERKLMLAELAAAVATMPTEEAVEQIEALDEAAALEVLRKTSRKRRNEILEGLNPKRSRRLRRRL